MTRAPMSQEEFEMGVCILMLLPFAVGFVALLGGAVIDLLGWYDTFGGMF